MKPKPKFKIHDRVWITPKARADGATFEVVGRSYDKRFGIWFYFGKRTCSYAESLLRIAANKPLENAEKQV